MRQQTQAKGGHLVLKEVLSLTQDDNLTNSLRTSYELTTPYPYLSFLLRTGSTSTAGPLLLLSVICAICSSPPSNNILLVTTPLVRLYPCRSHTTHPPLVKSTFPTSPFRWVVLVPIVGHPSFTLSSHR